MAIKELLCLVVLLGVTSLMTHAQVDTCAQQQGSDGCSIPGGGPFFYEVEFTPACARHDVCYQCGKELGFGRKKCDNAFLRNMRGECDKLSYFKRWACKVWASVYYSTVRVFGASSYLGTSRDYCTQAWVPACLPSKK